MLSDEQFQIAQPKLKILQVIIAMLCAGVMMFALVSNLIAPWAESTMEISMLPLLGAVASFFSAILSFVMPGLVTGNAPQIRVTDPADDQQRDLNQAASVFMTGRIIRGALLEGGCFLNLVVYILDQSQLSLIAVAIGLFLLLLAFPTASGMRGWLDDKAVK